MCTRTTIARLTYPSPSPRRSHQRYRNINLFPINYAFRPRLRDRLTLPGMSLDRNPWASGEEDFHLLYRYSCLHSHFQALHGRLRSRFAALGTLPYQPPSTGRFSSFGTLLQPRYIYGARQLDQ